LRFELLNVSPSNKQPAADFQRFDTMMFDEGGNRLAGHAADARGFRLGNPFVSGALCEMS
jgi:hypothetical protein